MKPRVPRLPSVYLPASVNSHLEIYPAKGYFIEALGHGSTFCPEPEPRNHLHTHEESGYETWIWLEEKKIDGVNTVKWVQGLPRTKYSFMFFYDIKKWFLFIL